MDNSKKFIKALDYFESIEGKKNTNNPYSPIEKYSSLAIHHHYNTYADFPAIHFNLSQIFQTTGSVLFDEIAQYKEGPEKICEIYIDRKAKEIYNMMKRSGEVYLKYFEK